jgi:hypothetical protein
MSHHENEELESETSGSSSDPEITGADSLFATPSADSSSTTTFLLGEEDDNWDKDER